MIAYSIVQQVSFDKMQTQQVFFLTKRQPNPDGPSPILRERAKLSCFFAKSPNKIRRDHQRTADGPFLFCLLPLTAVQSFLRFLFQPQGLVVDDELAVLAADDLLEPQTIMLLLWLQVSHLGQNLVAPPDGQQHAD